MTREELAIGDEVAVAMGGPLKNMLVIAVGPENVTCCWSHKASDELTVPMIVVAPRCFVSKIAKTTCSGSKPGDPEPKSDTITTDVKDSRSKGIGYGCSGRSLLEAVERCEENWRLNRFWADCGGTLGAVERMFNDIGAVLRPGNNFTTQEFAAFVELKSGAKVDRDAIANTLAAEKRLVRMGGTDVWYVMPKGHEPKTESPEPADPAAPPSLSVGDTVRLNSGGPLMTILVIHENGNLDCEWMSIGEVKQAAFPAACVHRESHKPR